MSRAELEGRFVKRFGVQRFVGSINASEPLQKEMLSALHAAEDAVLNAADDGIHYTIELGTQKAELAVITAPDGKGLNRGLYQRSKFFKWISSAHVSKSKGLVLYETIDATGAVRPITYAELDTFNQYVLLHFMPYIFKVMTEDVTEEDLQSREACAEVVADKLNVLRGNSE
jgi:hypothetical protein